MGTQKKYITVSISKTFLAGLALILIGGLAAYSSKKNAEGIMERPVQAGRLTLSGLEKGQYVTGRVGDIGGYVHREEEKEAERLNFFEKLSYLPGLHYHLYLLPIGKSGYEYIVVKSDRELSDLLYGQPEPGTVFTGKIVDSTNEKRYSYLEAAFGTKDRTVINTSVSGVYALRILDLEKEQLHIKEGLSVLAAGLLFLLVSLLRK